MVSDDFVPLTVHGSSPILRPHWDVDRHWPLNVGFPILTAFQKPSCISKHLFRADK